MKKIFLLISLLLIQMYVFSQHQADNWFFGNNAGLNFSTGFPVAITTGALSTTEGCSTISDALGNLLFYTNGVSVWNRNNQVMPNGDSLKGDISSTQSALIVPSPGSTDIYYIFTVAAYGGPDGLQYSIVDMTQDSGLGDVTTKNIFIQDSLTEKVAAEQESNGVDYWVVIHQWGTNKFFSYSLTSTGLQAVPVVSSVGMIHSTSQFQNTYGQMKFSTCSDKLALAAGYMDTVQVFDFDNSTGIFSNPITLPENDHVYGVEFSPDGNLLYVTCYDYGGSLLQYDLTSNDEAIIIASKIIISSLTDLRALQLGPDYKIYVDQSFNPAAQLGVINDPNVAGPFCNWDNTGVNLDPNYQGIIPAIGLPEFVQSFFKAAKSCGATATQEIMAGEKNLLFPNPSSEEFTLDLSTLHSISTVIVRDEQGKIIAKYTGIASEKFSFGKNLSAGIYTVYVQNESGSTPMMAVKAIRE